MNKLKKETKKLLALLPLKISNLTMSKIPPEAVEAEEEVSEVEIIKEKTRPRAEVEDLITTTKAVAVMTTKAVAALTTNSEGAGVAIETTKISIKVTLTLNVKQLLKMVTKISSMLKRSPDRMHPEPKTGSQGL